MNVIFVKNYGRERPDFVWDCKTHMVILEVDEYQHSSRNCECEQTRMANITSSFGMPCLWIRYNPDEYKGMKQLKEATRRDILEKMLLQSRILSRIVFVF